jgi:hypothetical protein
MARIQLRDATIYLQDGLAGTALLNNGGPTAAPDTSVTISTVALNTDDVTLVPVGARFQFDAQVGSLTYTVVTRDGPPTLNITFTPAVGEVIADATGITFLPQRLEIKIGEGDLAWTEAREFIYDLDRDVLDTVRQGQDQPVSVDMAFTFEYVTAETANPPTPVDALNRDGLASEWVSSSADLCEPYAVDVVVLHCVPCGTDQDQEITLPDFRYEALDYSVADASISVSGQCNATRATTVRSDHPDCA